MKRPPSWALWWLAPRVAFVAVLLIAFWQIAQTCASDASAPAPAAVSPSAWPTSPAPELTR